MDNSRVEKVGRESLQRAGAVIQEGGLVVAKSYTAYGVFCDALQAPAVSRLRSIKGSDASKPLALIADPAIFARYAEVDPWQRRIINILLPGEVSVFLLKRSTELDFTVPGTSKICFIWQDGTLGRLYEAAGVALASTSANLRGDEIARDVHEAYACFGDRVDLYLDEGRATAAYPTTQLDITSRRLSVAREVDPVPLSKIKQTLRQHGIDFEDP